MKKEKTKEELHDYYNASNYYIPTLQHYVEFQDHYRQLLPDDVRPLNANILPLNLVSHILNHLAGEDVPFKEVIDQTITHAKLKGTSLAMVGVFSCRTCQVKDVFPIEIKTNRDHIEYMKNGRFDFEAYAEYSKIEEEINLNMMVPENFAPDCTCKDTESDFHHWVNARTHMGVLLSEQDVEDLTELTLKKKQSNLLRLHTKKKEK